MAIIVVAAFVVTVAVAAFIVVVCTASETRKTAVYALCVWVLGLFLFFSTVQTVCPSVELGLESWK